MGIKKITSKFMFVQKYG